MKKIYFMQIVLRIFHLILSTYFLFSCHKVIAQNLKLTQENSPPAIQLATTYNESNIENINRYWISEKLDGVRGYWDGSYLYTRSGHKIITPKGYTTEWPNTAMDGELWSKRNDFSFIVSCVKNLSDTNACWQHINFMMFDLPTHSGKFSERITHMQKLVEQYNIALDKTSQIRQTSLRMILQFKVKDISELLEQLETITLNSGEGLMLHHEEALYSIGRTPHLLKLKKHEDDEAIVLKHIAGKGKNQGKLGAILVKNSAGKTFKIGSGFNDAERESPPPIGCIITYRYTGKTINDIPRFARFMRIRNE